MKFRPQKITGHIPAGTYKGVILEQKASPDERYLWLKIDVDTVDSVLNIAIPCNSMIFNSFSSDFIDEKGTVETEDFVDTEIEFTVKDREINGEIYSRFSKINAIMEDENND